MIANRGQSLFTDRDLRGPLPLIANRDQSLFTDRDLRGPLPLIANRGQSLFTDRDLLAPLPLITNRGQSLFTNRVLLQGGIPESGTASKVISSPGTVLGNQDDIGSIIASCCICCRAGIISVNRALEPA